MSAERDQRLAFKCPECQTENSNPRKGVTEGGTPIVFCDGCSTYVSIDLILEKIEERRKAINRFLGWPEEVHLGH